MAAAVEAGAVVAAGVVVEVVVVQEAEVNNITQQSRNQCSADKVSGV